MAVLPPRVSPEEEQAGVLLVRVRRLLLVGVDIIKDRIAGGGPLPQGIDDLHRLVRVDVVVPDQDVPHVLQGHVLRNGPVHGKQQAAVISKDRVVYHVPYQGVTGHWLKFQRRTFFTISKETR